jgi:(p)ppGpp synthase/HD superfamily hydrolase
MVSEEPTFVISDRFERAVTRAVALHRGQGRKGSGVPYAGHLLSVAGYVLEDGGSEDEAIAALLHDAIEDQNYDGLTDELRTEFGESVVEIVVGCSQEISEGPDRVAENAGSWKRRKRNYLKHLDDASPSILRVSLADKLHNIRSILRDHRELGDGLWKRFNAGPEATLWYYSELNQRYQALCPGAMAGEFADDVERLRVAVQG